MHPHISTWSEQNTFSVNSI